MPRFWLHNEYLMSFASCFTRDFGTKVIQVKPMLKFLPKLLEDRDKNVRDETKALVIELYRWIGAALKPQMSNFKPIQVNSFVIRAFHQYQQYNVYSNAVYNILKINNESFYIYVYIMGSLLSNPWALHCIIVAMI